MEAIIWCLAWLLFRAVAVFRGGGQRPETRQLQRSPEFDRGRVRWLPNLRKRRDSDLPAWGVTADLMPVPIQL